MISELIRDVRAARALVRTKRLVGEVYTPVGVEIWLTARNRRLGHHTPLELIMEGFGDIVVAEAERLASL